MKKKLILMITPALAGGSFIALKRLAEIPNSNFKYVMVGLGNYTNKPASFKLINIPYFRYDGTWGHLASRFTFLGLLSEIPLYLLSFYYLISLRPSIVIINGLATTIPLLPLTKLLGIKIVLSFRSWWDNQRYKRIEPLIKYFGRGLDLTFVNSEGTRDNLETILPSNKILIIEHHAPKIYFSSQNRKQLRIARGLDKSFVILYVGRIDSEKHCDYMLKTASKLKKTHKIKFIFIGEGRLKKQLLEQEKKDNTVHYAGFINEPAKLAEFYNIADLLWTNTDETYLARPAVEALACGTPILVLSTPAIGEKILKKIHVTNSLIPKKIGWVLDKNKPTKTLNLLKSLSESHITNKMRSNCRSYAKKHYAKDNNLILLEKLRELTQK